MKKNAYNPYLPSWEYVPDAEPYVFDGRVYIYGSHDRFGSFVYCENDYVCWSAPVEDLGDWRYEGVIYRKTDDPENADGAGCLYAPDLTRGPDGRYYLYYALDNRSLISVAVSDSPAGKYAFYGYVHYPDGVRYGHKSGDAPRMFDPGVLTEGDKTYLYTGFCPESDTLSQGAMVCVLDEDMLTIRQTPVCVVPGVHHSAGTCFAGHAFFEASSIRKRGETYYFVYSSQQMHELCYAVSKSPLSGFTYGGVLVSNNDLGIGSYKPERMPAYYGGNNHGSIVQIGQQWYVFYHRHTNGTNYSRQTCAEPIAFREDGSIAQAELTSCGLNGGPLPGRGKYPAYIACNLFCRRENPFTGSMGGNGLWMDACYPKITQDGDDNSREDGFILNMTDGATAGFKYFRCGGIRQVKITTRGYGGGAFEVRTRLDGGALGRIPIRHTNIWTEYSADIPVPDGVNALYFTYTGEGTTQLSSFELL